MRIDCEKPATQAVKIVVPDADSGDTASEGLIGVELCDEHMAEAEIWDLEELKAFKAFVVAIATPGTSPDMDEAYVESVPLGSIEHKAFLSLASRPN